MTRTKNTATLIKKCVCGYVGRGDTFKKHRAERESCKVEEEEKRYYCHHHRLSMPNGMKLKTWHDLHRDCPNNDIPIKYLRDLFTGGSPAVQSVTVQSPAVMETSTPSELDSAILPILESQAVEEEATTPSELDSAIMAVIESQAVPQKVLGGREEKAVEEEAGEEEAGEEAAGEEEEEEEQEGEKEDESVMMARPTCSRQLSWSSSSSSSDDEAPPPQTSGMVRPTCSRQLSWPSSSSSSDDETPPPQTSGIARQLHNYRQHPKEITNFRTLQKRCRQLEEELNILKAKYTNLERIEREYSCKKVQLENDLEMAASKKMEKEKFAEKAATAVLAKEAAERKLSNAVQSLSNVMEENRKMTKKIEELEKKQPSLRKSRLHIPLYKGEVPTKPLLFPYASSNEECFRRKKKGVECLHFVLDHMGEITNHGMESIPSKRCKFIAD